MKKIFYLEESCSYEKKILIKIKHEDLKFRSPLKGSYAIFISRVLNLSYANYLRFARDVLGADIIGKGCGYPLAFFDNTEEVKQFLLLLNKRINFLI